MRFRARLKLRGSRPRPYRTAGQTRPPSAGCLCPACPGPPEHTARGGAAGLERSRDTPLPHGGVSDGTATLAFPRGLRRGVGRGGGRSQPRSAHPARRRALSHPAAPSDTLFISFAGRCLRPGRPAGAAGAVRGCGAAAWAGVTWARRGAQRWRGARGGCSLAPPVGGAARSPHPPGGGSAPRPRRGVPALSRGKGGVSSPAGLPGLRTPKEGLHRREDAARPRAGLWLGGGAVTGEVENKSMHLTASV